MVAHYFAVRYFIDLTILYMLIYNFVIKVTHT
jgi:hypothetical protein